MGSYDHRCILTGLSLSVIEVTAVPIQWIGEGYRPVALGVSGEYDGYGSVMPEHDANTELIVGFFRDRRSAGDFVVAESDLAADFDIEGLLEVFERNDAAHEGACPVAGTLNGSPVLFSLVAQQVWEAITDSPEASRDQGVGESAGFSDIFGNAPAATQLYAGHLPTVTEHVRQLRAVDAFMRRHGLAWVHASVQGQRYPTEVGMQHTPAETADFLAAARRDWAAVPALAAAFDAYERVVADILDEAGS